MTELTAEFVATMMLVLLGDGVCANVNLRKTYGHDSGWIVVATGWGLAVAFAAYLANTASGAHLNPAVSIAFAVIGEMEWDRAALYSLAQMGGAVTGAALVWLTYLPHWKETEDALAIRGCFCNTPAIPYTAANLMAEAIGTFALMLGVLGILTDDNLAPHIKTAVGPALVGMIVWLIGLSLGGATGYAINPARDLGPRIAHAMLPIANKGDSGWSYSWIPVVGPIIGAVAAGLFYKVAWGV